MRMPELTPMATPMRARKATPEAAARPALEPVKKAARPWLRVLGELSPRRRLGLALVSFIAPLALWSAISYLPFLWHPMVRIADPGGVTWFARGQLVERPAFDNENAGQR